MQKFNNLASLHKQYIFNRKQALQLSGLAVVNRQLRLTAAIFICFYILQFSSSAALHVQQIFSVAVLQGFAAKDKRYINGDMLTGKLEPDA